jgi:glycosyltransferase involved in cell wall biosynthesis
MLQRYYLYDMKIAIVSTFYPYRGGIASFNDRMSKALEAEGHEVNCYNWSRQYPSFLFPGESQTISGQPTPTGSEAPLDSINPRTWKNTAERILADGEMDVLLLPFWHASLAPALRSVTRRVKKLSPSTKIVALMHNASSHDGAGVDRWLTKRFLKRVDSCITLSENVKDEVSLLHPDMDCKVLFHPLYDHYPKGISSVKAKAELGIPEDAKVALFFGLIRPYKGLSTLLKAASGLNTSIHILIAGECYGEWEPYQELIDDSGCSDRIHVINRFIDEAELPAIFSASDCVVLPYLQASQSGVVATALHYNKAIIASDVGDLSGSIQDGVTGQLVTPGDSDMLGRAINDWMYEEHTGVEKSYDTIRNEKSWSAFAGLIFKS